MSILSRPSYFPKSSIAPPRLCAEGKHWTLDPELVLSEESALEITRSHQLMEELLESGTLNTLGLDPKLSGLGSLKGHSTRVAILSLLINEQLMKEKSEMAGDTRILAASAILHDIGKLNPEIHSVVMVPDKISRDEAVAWTIIKRHPSVGRDVAMAMPGLSYDEREKVADTIYKHHERQDGRGYHNTPVSDIPKEAQIISAADTMDVMLGKRPYKSSSTTDEVIAELERCTGQFNQEVASAAKKLRPSSGDFVHYQVKAA